MASAPVLLTLGYQQRALDEFLGMLVNASVDVLIDVRETAWSHKPGFSKSTLACALEKRGIAYVHARFAGNPKRFRESAESQAECLRLYAEHLDADGTIIEMFDELVGRLLDAGKRVCLTCFERDPDDCHRGVLVERWREGRYGTVLHLGVDRTANGRRRVYPASKRSS